MEPSRALLAVLDGVTVVHPGGVVALDNVSLTVRSRESIALVGPSGAGKTTVLAVLAGLVRATSGSATAFGLVLPRPDTRDGRSERRRVGLIHQAFALTDALSVEANVAAGGLGGRSILQSARALARATNTAEALSTVGLDGLGAARVNELSGGQRQRVAIARLLVQDPDLTLADEPAASLDPSLAKRMARLLAQRSLVDGRATVASLHDPSLALENFDRIIGLDRGRVMFDRSAGEVDAALLDSLYESDRG